MAVRLTSELQSLLSDAQAALDATRIAPGPRKLTLDFSGTGTLVSPQGKNYRIKIKALNAVGMEAEVFVNVRNFQPTGTNSYYDSYSHVASPVDMLEIPTNPLAIVQGRRQYRTSEVDIVIPTTQYMQKFIKAIVVNVCYLISSLNELDNLQNLGSIDIGNL